jgi:hypothetical protein
MDEIDIHGPIIDSAAAITSACGVLVQVRSFVVFARDTLLLRRPFRFDTMQ